EPQAAFYAWIDNHRDHWDQLVKPGQKILILDIGGGTSDLTLIRVRRGEGGKVQFHRVAVGDHLILGGDNLDLALAHHLERRLTGQDSPNGPMPQVSSESTYGKLTIRQWSVLVGTCRAVKERLLRSDAPEQLSLNLPGSGSKLIGGGTCVDVTRDEVHQLLLDGFFPYVGLDDKPIRQQSGFQEFGLPYAPDPAVTRYLAAFLTAHRHVALDAVKLPADQDPARPDIVLFNGGVLDSKIIRDRLLDMMSRWFHPIRNPERDGSSNQSIPEKDGHSAWIPLVLENERLDLAVAHGAAYYGMVRRGQGVRIAAGLARTYYIGVAGDDEPLLAPTKSTRPDQKPSFTRPPANGGHAMCLLPAGIEPGQDMELSGQRFHLLVSEPVEFPLFVSSSRLTDEPGEFIPINSEWMTALPPIRTVLKSKKRSAPEVVAVELHARLTEIGTLDLWCSEIEGRRSWRLQFDIRSTTQTELLAHESDAETQGYVDEETQDRCRQLIDATFARDGKDNPAGLVKRLADTVGSPRNAWPASLCRRIWEALMDVEPGRQRSAGHEARWLNLLGFALRPGYGMAIDDWRVAETWRSLWGKFAHAAPMCRAEGWILWRRIGGGLSVGQQQALADPMLGMIRSLHRQLTTGRGASDFSYGAQETAEVWRLLGSLELLATSIKIDLGTMLLELFPKRKMEPVREAIAWALGRLGARVPAYGPLNRVVPIEVVLDWLPKLMEFCPDDAMGRLAVMQMARRTDDRYRDLPEKQRATITAWLSNHNAPHHFIELVDRGGRLDSQEQNLVFGEALPRGLRAISAPT
ncbi:MAG: molecular chaperone DnaK, partial [Pirellulales bacterium]|nr:molecular chaperone DnaK [Pirellulales bacterium]